MKKIVLAVALVAAFPLLAQAKVLKFPSDAPIASVTIPNNWGPKETESGVDATSDDSAIYFSIDVADQKSMDKVISDAIDFLGENGVKIDNSTKKETDPTDLNGMQMATIDWDGTDKDGPVSVGLALVAPDDSKMLVVTYWGTKGDEDKHAAELSAIMSSLKPVK